MKKLIQPLTALLYSLVAVLLGIGVYVMIAFSWFTNTELVEPDLSGFSVSAYFGGGNGSPDDPFLIKNNRHLYNLCWLQYLGYFNKQGALDEHGRIVTQGHENEMTQFSFSIETNLNMSGWYLPPLGTTLNPFVGLLNGQGHTISGLQTTNTFSEFGNKHPSSVNASNFANVEVIGFAGVIGKYDSMRLNSLSIDPDANAIANIKLSGTQVRTKDSTLAGIAAGYINGTVEDVGIVGGEIYFNANSSVFGSMSDISAYTVAGYATDGYVTRTSTTKATVLNPTNTVKTNYVYENPGDSDSWGGSIDMYSLYRRINAQTNTRRNSYISKELYYYDENGEYERKIDVSTNLSTAHYYDSYSNGSGAYLTQQTAPYNGYDYLTGLYKKVSNVEIIGTTSGFKIKAPNANNYLTISSTRQTNTTDFTVTLPTNGTTNVDNATNWIESARNGGVNIYAYNKDDGYQYYLNANTTTISVSDNGTTTWKYDANYGYYITQNEKNYYLRYINNQWTMSEKLSYLITDNYDHYLSRNNTNVTNVIDYAQATRWIFENENGLNGSYGAIYDESDTSYKLILNNNGNLACSTTNTPTSWSNNGNNLYNDNKFIAYYDNAWKIYINNAKYIKYGNYYLTINSNGTINNTETELENASTWLFSNNDTNPKGYLTTTIGETTYYLSFNNSNTNKLEIVTNQTQAIQWANDGDGAYYTYNNVKYYLQYKNSTWQAAQAAQKTGYKISYNNTYYLNAQDTTNITAGTNVNDATVWFLDSNNHIYCLINNTSYYLYYYDWNSADLGLTTNSSANYMPTKNNNTLRTYGRSWYYITYNYGWTDTSNSTNLNWANASTEDFNNTPIPTFITNTNAVPYTCDLRGTNPNMNKITLSTYKYNRTTEKEVPSLFNYIPLNTNNDNTVKDTNTGYIMSGGHSPNSGGLTAVDIRTIGNVSSYSISGRISTSVDSSSGNILANKVYTYDGTFHTINDSNNSYEKYAASRKNMQETLQYAAKSNNGRVGGIHFITSLISTDRLVTAPSVLINGQPYENYQMPENSIDFNLKTKGYINFFATLFYPGSSSFFSLHQITRNDDEFKTIKEINHIAEIYYNPNNKSLPYIYKYASQNQAGYLYSNNSNTLAAGYSLLFNTTWIETPNIPSDQYEVQSSGNSSSGYQYNGRYMKKLIYFEIPVNEGEYALGSVDGRDGGYLLYLDIGANAQQINRTEITQKSVVSQYDYVYPNGIAIIQESTTIDDAINNNSLDASKSSSFKVSSASAQQSIIATRTSNTAINFATAITNGAVVYKPRTVTVTKNNSAVQAAAVRTTTSIYSQIQYIDHNVTLGDIYETNIQQINSDPITYEIYKIGVQGTTEGFTRTLIDQSVTNPEWRLYAINTVGGTVKNVLVDLTSASDTNANAIKTQLTNIANTTVTTANTCLDYEYDTVTGATNTYAIHINMTIDNNELYYYKFTGDDVTVTTDNVGGTIIYVNVSNTTYTFRLLNNDHTANLVVGTNVTLPLQ